MKTEDIIRVIESETNRDKCFQFDLSNQIPIVGIIAKGADYQQLKKSNIWRFVNVQDIPAWHKTNELRNTELIHGKLVDKITVL